MKRCSSCEQEKALSDFYKDKNTKDGATYRCKECVREKQRQYNLKNPKPKKPRGIRMDGFRKLQKGMRKCGVCQEVKELEFFYKDSSRASGASTRCKSCLRKNYTERRKKNGVKMIEVRRRWRDENREKLQEQDKLYRKNNRAIISATERDRRMKLENMPDTLTPSETSLLISHFNHKCAICESDYEQLDHFIPVTTGQGGTTKENTVPLCVSCNLSKGRQNPFDWKFILKQNELSNFYKLIEYLAVLNGMTVKQYETHVSKCFEI